MVYLVLNLHLRLRTLVLISILLLPELLSAQDSIRLATSQDFREIYNSTEQRKDLAYWYIDQGKNAYMSHQYDSSFYYLDVATRISDKSNNARLKGDALHHTGRAHYYKDQNDEAVKFYLQALKYRRTGQDTAGLAETYNSLGVAYKHMTEYSSAIRAFNSANEYYYLLGDSAGIGTVDLNIGNVLKSLGRNDMAKAKYFKALDIFLKTDSQANVASCYNNLGNVYKNENNIDSAFYFMHRTMQLRMEQGGGIPLSYVYHNLANLHKDIGNYDSAMHYIEVSLAIKSQYDNPVQLANDYETFGSIYEAQGKWQEATRYYELTRKMTEGLVYENEVNVSRSLAECYYYSGQYRKAGDLFIEYFRLRDSISGPNDASLIQDELIRYDFFSDSIRTEQLVLENELQQALNEKNQIELESNQRRYFFTVAILAMLLIMIIYLFVSSRRRLAQTHRHQQILTERNEELRRTLISKEEKEILLKELHHRVKNNLQIINSLIRLQSNFMTEGNFHEKLMETENRVRSMALIHEKLYKSENLSSLSVRNYIEELSIHVSESYENNLKVKYRFDVEQREYRIDSLIPLGLIINEILSNSMKYAFFERESGNISIRMVSDESTTWLNISDDGLGADLTLENLKEGSLGMDLILSLTEQLDGELHLNTKNGFHYEFKFPRLK